MDVTVLTADDWKTLRDLRLRALRDSPAAFIATYDAEERLTEAEWRSRLETSEWVVARSDQHTIGLACSTQGRGPRTERHIESVWVDREHRRAGVLRAILQHLIQREPDVRDWLVWVLDGNDEARAVYEHLGFEPTGRRQPLKDDSGRWEERLRLRRTDDLVRRRD